MKTRNFILSFLMMMFCSVTFGQNWGDFNYHDYPNNMTVKAVISIDGELQSNSNLTIAPYCGDVRRGEPAQAIKAVTGKYIVDLLIYGETNGDLITFKLFDGEYMYDNLADYSKAFEAEAVYGNLRNPVNINFKSVAKVGEDKYGKLQVAVNAAEGKTVEVINDVTLKESVVVANNTTIDFGNKAITANVYPAFRIQGNANVTVKNGNITNNDYVFVLGASDGSSAGDLTIESGKYVGEVSVASVTKGILTIKGGEFNLQNVGQYGYTYLINCIDNNYPASANVVVTGGKFYGFNPENNAAEGAGTNFCAEGYVASEYTEGGSTYYIVEEGGWVAQNTTTGVRYKTLQAAIDACTAGDNTIVLLANISDDVTVNETAGVNIKIEGDKKEYSGTINIVGNSTYGDETLSISNVKFVTSEKNHDFIWSDSQNAPGRYCNNVSVDKCYFVATGEAKNTAVGLRIRQGKNIDVTRSVFEGMHSAMQMNGTLDIYVVGLEIKDSKNGISASGQNTLVVEDSRISVEGYGVRTDGTNNSEASISFATINANLPIVVREVKGAYNLTVESGSYTASNEKGAAVTFTAGDDGTFVAPTANATATIKVDVATFGFEARIGNVYYTKFDNALAAAEEGDTITVLNQVVITENKTYDLAGLTVTGATAPNQMFRIQDGANVTVKNANITNNSHYVFVLGAKDKSTAGYLTIENGTYVGETTVAHVVKGLLTINGGEFKISDVDTYDYAYLINCDDANFKNGTAKVEIKGGKFYSFNPENNAAEGAGTNFCAEGYEAKHNSDDDTYIVRRKPAGHVAYRADVTDKADREGIAVLLKEVYAFESLVVKVYNNETLMFTCTRREIDDEGKIMFPVEGANTTANIVLWGKESGSWINDIIVEPTELNVPNKIEIWSDGVLVETYTHESGTVLGTNLPKYLALDCVKKAVAKVGETKYMSLAEAVNACPNEGTVTVLRDATGAGVVIDKDITIDFNEKTYTFNKTVGSTGTTTLGLQILKDNNVTLKNGTLTSTAVVEGKEVKMLVQNYANLTLTDMNLVDNTAHILYALSNNSGTVNINGATNITTDKVAFDVCKYASYAAPTVNVETTGIIEGAIEVTAEINNNLNISGGLFTAQIQEAWCAEGYIPTTTTVDGVTYYTVKEGKYVAQIGTTKYETFAAALAVVQDGEIIELFDVEGNENTEINFDRKIAFTIKGNAPKYALPVVTFTNAKVNIEGSTILIPELDARQNATINVISSTVYDAGGNSIVKSYYNGAINIDANSTVYTMQVTTMGYITVAGTLNATWQTNVYGNGLITLNDGAKFNTAALQLTGQDYNGRDNTDANRVGEPAEIIVNGGAKFVVGSVKSSSGADYSYNSSKGINIGTVAGKSAILTLNGGNVDIYMADGQNVNIGALGTVEVGASTMKTICRSENGTVGIINNGTINFSKLTAELHTAQAGLNVTTTVDGYAVKYVDGVYKLVANMVVNTRTNETYPSFAEAIAAATAGDELKFLANINESVTINKNLTINGNKEEGISYTGTMTGNAGLTINIKNVNFVNAGFKKDTKSTNGTYNFKQCTFDGQETYAYPIYFKGANTVKVEDCQVKDYLYGFIYMPNSTTNVNVKNVVVENCSSYAVFFNSGVANAMFENMTVKGSEIGVRYNNGTASRTFSMRNCTMEDVETAVDGNGGTYSVTCKLEGNQNNFGGATLGQTAKVTLINKDVTLASTQKNLNVVSGDANYIVAYEGGVYKLVEGSVWNETQNKKYGTLQAAIDASKAGDVIKLLANVNYGKNDMFAAEVYGYTVMVNATGKNIVLDLNGYTISTDIEDSTELLYAVIFVGDNGSLTLRDSSVTGTGTIIAKAGLDKDGKGNIYSLLMADTKATENVKMYIESGNYELDESRNTGALVYVNISNILTVTGGNFYLGNAGTLANNSPWIFNTYLNGENSVIVKGGNYNVTPLHYHGEVIIPEGYSVVNTDDVKYPYSVVPAQVQTLAQGWNWFSSYIADFDGVEGLNMLKSSLGNNGVQIKNQLDAISYQYYEGEYYWVGDNLKEVSVTEMYMIKTSAPVELFFTGNIADPAKNPITLKGNKGWTWIGYPVATSMNVETAFDGIEPQDGDIIKTHNGVAQYYENIEAADGSLWSGWYGQALQSMTPGMGYMYYNTSNADKTLVYPAANTRAEVRANVTAENNRWVPNASAFASNMNIIAVLESNDMMGEFEVAAFVNGEVRGSARPTYVEPIDAYVLFMTIYGEEGEEMTFKYYDIYSDEEHVISNTVAYSDNAVIGSIKEPYMFFANTLGMEENAASALSIYPNPTTTNAAISFDTVYDMVEVFNALGSKVAEYRNVDRIEGMEAAGVYVIRVTNDNAVQNCRLIVK